MNPVFPIAAMALLFWLGRAYHYKTVFGYWAWGPLRPGDADRLLPRDNQASYQRGYRDGVAAEQRRNEASP